MRVGIYTPYLDTFGGGERYMLTIAEILSKDHEVELLVGTNFLNKDVERLKEDLSIHLNIDLSRIKIVSAPIGEGSSFLLRLLFLKKYNLLFCLTDGSIFYSTAGKNILHIQTPIFNDQLDAVWNRIKLSSWDLVIFNSEFTKNNIFGYQKIKSKVIYPPVNTEVIRPFDKKKQILSVGRFFGFLREKKHEIMIKVFKDLLGERKAKGWSLHLVGSASLGDKIYIDELKNLTTNLPIFFYPNLKFSNLIKLYGESSIYWHAAGFGEEDPSKMEHFGITVVEAMAAGCVPVVINKGGLKEIIEDKKSGYFWNEVNELKEITLNLIANPKKMRSLSKQAEKRGQNFSKAEFTKKLLSTINEVV